MLQHEYKKGTVNVLGGFELIYAIKLLYNMQELCIYELTTHYIVRHGCGRAL